VGGPLIARRHIGTTGIELSRIGFGGAPLGDLKRAPSDVESRDLLQRAWDAGIRYFDTAPFYGSGLSERRIGDFLRDKPRDDFVLSTKVGRLLVPDRDWAMNRHGDARAMPFRPVFDFSYDGVMRSFEQSLQRLGLERIDILLLHDLGRFSQRERYHSSLAQALEGGVGALVELRESGAVRAIGAGVNEWQILDLLMDHGRWDVFLLANRYTLLDQEVLDTFLPRCRREGVAIIDGAPLHGGILATGAVPGAQYDYAPASEAMLEKVRGIEAICARYGVPLISAALNFPLGHEDVAAIIPGFSRPEELESNLQHYRTGIPPELWRDLKAEGLLHPNAPVPQTPAI
jgi:D-threo-aldose 1-dehydrogenase